ncbi:hypothetical protein BU16DRAFT_557563 [Lophium mytilinum]|uniref:Uncharacterized protein n=1 Tax=Lophium mytilinum TaxID=390894 RepID=A0A6A6R4E7_9PEZI|nr:hypothetical protein BU16DRAFT_557563 [Lophium mytilinum]
MRRGACRRGGGEDGEVGDGDAGARVEDSVTEQEHGQTSEIEHYGKVADDRDYDHAWAATSTVWVLAHWVPPQRGAVGGQRHAPALAVPAAKRVDGAYAVEAAGVKLRPLASYEGTEGHTGGQSCTPKRLLGMQLAAPCQRRPLDCRVAAGPGSRRRGCPQTSRRLPNRGTTTASKCSEPESQSRSCLRPRSAKPRRPGYPEIDAVTGPLRLQPLVPSISIRLSIWRSSAGRSPSPPSWYDGSPYIIRHEAAGPPSRPSRLISRQGSPSATRYPSTTLGGN